MESEQIPRGTVLQSLLDQTQEVAGLLYTVRVGSCRRPSTALKQARFCFEAWY